MGSLSLFLGVAIVAHREKSASRFFSDCHSRGCGNLEFNKEFRWRETNLFCMEQVRFASLLCNLKTCIIY